MQSQYPKRPSHFAHKFTRLLIKACVANELGAEAVLLLIAVAHTEDARGYRGAVTFWNPHMCPLIGARSETAFKRTRDKCVEAGWLAYRRGARGRAPAYWVMIPDGCAGWDDGPTDESPADYLVTTGANAPAGGSESGRKADGVRTESGRKADGKRTESGLPSSLSLSLTLSQEKTPLPPAKPGGGTGEPPTPDFEPTAGTNPWAVPLADLLAAWAAARLPGHAAPQGIQPTSARRQWWQMRLADARWRESWRAAVERAGRSAACRGEDPKFLAHGLRLDTFLKDPDMVTRLLEGEFDAAARPPAAHAPPPDAAGQRLKTLGDMLRTGTITRDEYDERTGGPDHDDDAAT